MDVNYFNSITVAQAGEAGFSVARKLDEWGTKILEPVYLTYGGYSYHVDVDKKETLYVGGLPTKNEASFKTYFSDKPGFLARIRACIGIAFKKVAAFFSAEVRAKYELVSAIGDPTNVTDPLYEKFPKKKVTPQKQGNDTEDCLACLDCCCSCFECMIFCCEPTPTYRYERRYHRC